MISFLAKITCPACGTECNRTIEAKSNGMNEPQLITCDDERGGCGEVYIIRTMIEATVKVYTITEAEQPKPEPKKKRPDGLPEFP